MKTLTTLALLILTSFTYIFAQTTAQYDVQLVQEHPFQCGDGTIYFDIQVKASNAGSTFRLAEQNYRFDYDLSVLSNPRIDQELDISGAVPDGIGTSLYIPHTLTGSLGPTVCYNVSLSSGAGYLLTNSWVSVGRVAFDIINTIGCVDLVWRTQNSFPITYVGEIYNNGELRIANEGTYNDFSGCLSNLCASCPANLNLSYVIPDNLYQADISVTSDGTVPDGGTVDYRAGNIITLDVGFTAEDQADFSAVIEGCN